MACQPCAACLEMMYADRVYYLPIFCRECSTNGNSYYAVSGQWDKIKLPPKTRNEGATTCLES